MDSKVAVIVGPTCSGKTELGILLSEKIKTEIISADSRQIYKYLNIGTAKPSEGELNSVKHHLIDALEPGTDYNASKFEKDALSIIDYLKKQQIMPVVIGGSGLYVKALIDGIFDSVDTDSEFRSQIMEARKIHGNHYLFDMLKKIDPKTASSLLPQNWKRIIRALEVYHITGEPIWKHQEKYKRDVKLQFLQFGLKWDREILYRNIENRVDRMLENGLVSEVEKILSMGYDKNINALNTVGYKEIIGYLENETGLEEAVRLIKRNTRRYAKRQMTWFRADRRIKWFNAKSTDDLIEIRDNLLSELKN